MTPPTIAPTLGPVLEELVGLVMPDNDCLTQDADAQDVQDAAVCRQTSSELQTGHDGEVFGQTTQRLKRWEVSGTGHTISDIST